MRARQRRDKVYVRDQGVKALLTRASVGLVRNEDEKG